MDATDNSKEVDESSLRAAERQRISRELHDSTSQLLIALQLQLGQLRRHGIPGAEPLLDEMDQVLRHVQASIKQVSLRPNGDDEDIDRAKIGIAKAFHSLARPPT